MDNESSVIEARQMKKGLVFKYAYPPRYGAMYLVVKDADGSGRWEYTYNGDVHGFTGKIDGYVVVREPDEETVAWAEEVLANAGMQ